MQDKEDLVRSLSSASAAPVEDERVKRLLTPQEIDATSGGDYASGGGTHGMGTGGNFGQSGGTFSQGPGGSYSMGLPAPGHNQL